MPTSPNPWRSRARKAAILLFIIGMIALAGRVVLRSEWMRGEVLEKLRSVVMKLGGPAYTLNIGKVDIDLIGGDMTIADIALEADTSSFLDRLRTGYGQPMFSIHAGSISVSGLSYWHLLVDAEIHLATLRLNTPVLGFTYASRGAADSTRVRTDPAPNAPDPVSIGELVISNASGTMIDLSNGSAVTSLGRMDLRVEQLHVVLPAPGRAARWEMAKAQLGIDDVRKQLPPLYDLSIGHVGLMYPEGIAMIDSLRYTPRIDRKNTHEFLKEMTSIYNLRVGRISIARFDLDKTLAERNVNVGQVIVDGVWFDVFLDKSMPEDPSHFKPLPMSALHRIPFGITVDTIRLIHAEMIYAERFEVANGYGNMHMTDIGVSLLNVSNDTLRAEGKELRGVVDAKLFEVGALHGIFRAPMDAKYDAFTLDATLRDMPLTAANSMCENLLLMRADSGWISSLNMHMNANNDSATGPFTLRYSDAWFQVKNGDGSKRRFLTQVANTAVHHDSHERPVNERTMHLHIARKKDRSLFNFIWIFTREGLTRTLLPAALADIQSTVMKQKGRMKKASQRRDEKARKKKQRH